MCNIYLFLDKFKKAEHFHENDEGEKKDSSIADKYFFWLSYLSSSSLTSFSELRII